MAETFLRKLFLVLKNKRNVIHVRVFMCMRRQSRSGFRLWNSDGNHRSQRSFSDGALPRKGNCHWDAHVRSLRKFSGLQLSSLLKHMLNLQRNIFPRRGAQRFSVNQADLTGRHEHILLRLSRHGCLKPSPRISQQGLLMFNQDRSHRMQNSRVGENKSSWEEPLLCALGQITILSEPVPHPSESCCED